MPNTLSKVGEMCGMTEVMANKKLNSLKRKPLISSKALPQDDFNELKRFCQDIDNFRESKTEEYQFELEQEDNKKDLAKNLPDRYEFELKCRDFEQDIKRLEKRIRQGFTENIRPPELEWYLDAYKPDPNFRN